MILSILSFLIPFALMGEAVGADEHSVPVVGAPAPPPPLPPAVMSRNVEGGLTVRAVRLIDSIKIDGHLDESFYASTPPINGFIQQEPREGEPATEDTDVWFFYDADTFYIAARCWDSHPELEVANEMRRDHANLSQNESITFVLDTFHDRRNSFHFLVNRLGAVSDGLDTDERSYNGDWNTVWTVRTAPFEHGWTLEWAIPFKSLRYAAGSPQIWGVNARRTVRWKNEMSYMTRIPAFLGQAGLMRMSLAATMVGLEVPTQGRILEIKPYAISGVRTDQTVRPAVSNDLDRNGGLDLKYGLSKGLTADFTVNTDFAQVEDDLQQVNLTRFSLFFPEKREFFLEGSGTFAFGGAGVSGGGVGPDGDPDDTPVLFFSRRIGLNDTRQIPIEAGGRVTGKAGSYNVGALAIRTDEDTIGATPPTTVTVLRLKRDLLKRSTFGGLYTRRSQSTRADGASETYGLDAKYAITPGLNIDGFWSRTRTPGLSGSDMSYLGRFDYSSDRYGARVERLVVGGNFNPDVGFLRRRDFARDYAQLRFSPRPRADHWRRIRKLTYRGSFASYSNGTGRIDLREGQGQFNVELQTSDRIDVQVQRDYEFVPQPFTISRGVVVPAGGYDYGTLKLAYQRGGHRRFSGWLVYEQGSLYEGTKRRLEYKTGRIVLGSRFEIEPGISQNWIDLPWGAFVASVVSARETFSVSPRLFVSALLQYNSTLATFSTNIRLRWEYRPGSEFFVVYNDGRDTRVPGFPSLQTRALVVKINRLVRF